VPAIIQITVCFKAASPALTFYGHQFVGLVQSDFCGDFSSTKVLAPKQFLYCWQFGPSADQNTKFLSLTSPFLLICL
jgi:hypothetical protein